MVKRKPTQSDYNLNVSLEVDTGAKKEIRFSEVVFSP